MTAVLGVLCEDGIVLGSDGASSVVRKSGEIRYERAKRKVWVVGGRALGATSGNADFGQRVKVATGRFFEINENCPATSGSVALDKYDVADQLRRKIMCELRKVDMEPKDSDKSLIAFPVGDEYSIVKFSGPSLRPKLVEEDLNYETIGSGSLILNPFFEFLEEIFWGGGLPTIDEATLGVVWALNHAIATSSAGVNTPLTVGLIRGKEAPELLEPAITQEAEEFIAEMKTALREYMNTRPKVEKPTY